MDEPLITSKQAKKLGVLTADIAKYSRKGAQELSKKKHAKACEAFELAYKRALQLNDDCTKRACAFNLGAIHIALGDPQKGVTMLMKAVPPFNRRDGKSNGDLYFNIGLGYEAMNNLNEAVKYYEQALEEYKQEQSNFAMECEVACLLGKNYLQMGRQKQAAKFHGLAAQINAHLGNVAKQTELLIKQASSLQKLENKDEAVIILDQCLLLSDRLDDSVQGNILNDIGLNFAQCQEFSKAAECFEKALPSCREMSGDKKLEAVILQNLGAVYNSVGDYQRALAFHEAAAALHGELGNRSSQGQSFTNLAYTYSQLGDLDRAGECYLHARQAARDSGDRHGQWQALEGLGAVSFLNNQIDKAARYFQQALGVLAATEQNHEAQDRIVGKLKDVLRVQLQNEIEVSSHHGDTRSVCSAPSVRERPSIDILVNGEVTRPPSTGIKKSKLNSSRRRRGELQHSVALGLGAYCPDSDISLSRSDLSEEQEEVDSYSQNWRTRLQEDERRRFSDSETKVKPKSKGRPLRNQGLPRRPLSGKASKRPLSAEVRNAKPREAFQEASPPAETPGTKTSLDSTGESNRSLKHGLSSSRRPMTAQKRAVESLNEIRQQNSFQGNRSSNGNFARNRRASAVRKRQVFKQALLRPEDYDSAGEYQERMKEIYSDSSDQEEQKFKHRYHPPSRRQQSRKDEKDYEEEPVNKLPVRARRRVTQHGNDDSDLTRSSDESEEEVQQQTTQTRHHGKETTTTTEETESGTESETESDTATSSNVQPQNKFIKNNLKNGENEAELESESETESETGSGSSEDDSQEQDTGTQAQMKAYAKHLSGIDEDEERSNVEVESEQSGNQAKDNDAANNDARLTPPPAPSPLNFTYETPISVKSEVSHEEDNHDIVDGFRSPPHLYATVDKSRQHEDVDSDIEKNRTKTSEKLYETIHPRESTSSPTEVGEPSSLQSDDEVDQPPPLPRKQHLSTRAKKEAIMFEYQKEQDLKRQKDVPLPEKDSKKTKSNVCTIS